MKNTHRNLSPKSKGIDFNLLVIFEAVFLHKSVTKTALILNVTPSAISQSLSKLRLYFSDPLFVREGNTLFATTVAENIYDRLKDGLSHVRQSLDYISDVSLQSSFIIHASPYLGVRLLPEICAEIENRDLNINISNNYNDTKENNIENILLQKKADIIFDVKPFYSFSTVSEILLIEDVIAVCAKNHPRLDSKLTKEDILAEKSIFSSIAHNGGLKVQSDIDDYFPNRKFIFSSNSIITNIAIAEKTSAISFIPKSFFDKFSDSFNIKMLELDITLEPVKIYMSYNKISLKNRNFNSLINIIKEHVFPSIVHPTQ
ncbi:LysR family transcriptional regulator [Hafnia alvei]|uniref:DNA-binding transcriptional regulator, LysR family n=1 Tax=Hafnia alvei TaxID=569 RepID=A0A1C6YW68_HAFAL|nr:LysR family transcriptional regulator [Hafnia alvei]NLS56150.1 LysR family transcriptional regulator [Hafnia alvei]SCM51072.1 DNA-binding transcriptional regulator, LysR family [Hafnia alvei]